jgi:hypothetical protein
MKVLFRVIAAFFSHELPVQETSFAAATWPSIYHNCCVPSPYGAANALHFTPGDVQKGVLSRFGSEDYV